MNFYSQIRAVLAVLLFSSVSFAQQDSNWVEMMQNPSSNFYDVQQAFEQYWQGKTIEKGKGYKQFRRWEDYMAPRVYPSGDMTLPSLSYENFLEWEAKQPSAGTSKSLLGTWTAMGPFGKPTGGGAGRLNFIRFDPVTPTKMYVGAPDGGLWTSTNGGTTWTTNTDQLTVIGCTDIAIDPTNTKIMYLATGDGEAGDSYSVGILKSTNGGATWNTTGLTWTASQGRTISKLLMHPTNSSILIAATSNGVYRSTNGGTSWTQTSTGNFKDMEFNPGNPNIMYVSGSILRRSTDNGVTWTTITSGLPTTGVQRISIAVSPANSAYVYLLIGRSSDQGLLGVYRSTDNGLTFTQRHGATGPNLLGWNTNGGDSGGQAFYDLSIAVSPTNIDNVITGGVNAWESTDGGTNWVLHAHWTGGGGAPYVHADIHDIVFTSGTTHYIACDGGLFRTTNSGNSFQDISGNLEIAQQYRIGLSTTIENKIISGHQDNGTNLLNAGTWAQIYGGDGMDCFIDRTNNNTLFGSYVYGDYYRSTNNGASWTTITTGLPGGTWLSAWHQDPVTATTLYAGGRAALYRSTNSGTNWSALGTPSGSGSIIEFAIAPSNNQTIYAVKSNAISRSTNGGTSWTNITGTLPVGSAALTNVAVSNTDPNKVWVTFSGYSSGNKVFASTNGGTTWTNISAGLPNLPCNTIVFENGSTEDPVYVGTDVGVYYRDNTQATWTSFFSGLPRCAVRDLEIYYPTGRIRAATFGRGTWESDLHTNGNDPPIAQFSANQVVCANSTVTFTDLSVGTPTSWTWSFPGGVPSSATGQGPHTVTYNTPGVYDASLVAGNAFGSDTELKTAYITVNSATAGPLPVTEGFTATTFPPTNWALNNLGIPYTWERTTTAGFGSTQSMFFNNYSNDDRGANDEVILPAKSFMGLSAAQLTFDVAYAPYNGTYYDGLEVLVSTDCGATFTQVYFKENTVLATDPANASALYVPGTWRNELVNLNAYIGNPNVLVKFRNIAGYGQGLYIDNVNLTGTSTPTAIFSASPSNACTGQTVTFTDASSSATSWSWNFGVGASPATATGAGPHTVTYASAGTKNITLTINGGASSTNQSVTITAPPVAGTLSGTQNVCAGSTTTFSSTQSGGAWSSSNGAIATVNPTTGVVTGVAAGTATMTYTVTGSGGCSNATATRTVTVTAPPVAGTLSGTQVVCVGLTTTFASTQSGGTWSSSNAGIASVNPSNGVVTGVAAGTATMTYTVTGTGGCSNATATRTVTVNATPSIAAGTVSNPSACATPNGSIQVTGSATGTVSWTGSASGSSGTVTLPYVITGLPAGSYTVTFVNASSCNSNTLNINLVDPTPPAAPTISAGGATTFCAGGSVTLTSSQATGNVWSTGATTQSIVVSSSGVYSVTYTNGAGCASTSSGTTVTVNAAPATPVISPNGATTFCAGGSVDLTSSSVTGNLWSNSATTATITVTTSGTYSVTVTDGNGCSSTSLGTNVTVNALPTAPTISASGPVAFCTGDSVVLTSSQTSNNDWSTGATTQAITVNTSGNYAVQYTDANGCSAISAITAVTVNAIPASPTITANGPTTFCAGQSVGLTSSSATGNAWSNGGTTQTITVTTAGTYTVTMTDANGCSATSSPTTISVNSLPTVTLGSFPAMCETDSPMTLTGGLPAGGTYSGTGVTGGTFDPAVAGVGSAQILYTYTDANNCENSAVSTIAVDDCASISEGSNVKYELYPNPSNGSITVVFGAKVQLIQALLFDAHGKQVQRLSTEELNDTYQWNLGDYPNGVYYLEMITEASVIREKVLLQK